MFFLIFCEWWVKVAGSHSRTSIEITTTLGSKSGAYSLKVAPLSSHMFPRWLNVGED